MAIQSVRFDYNGQKISGGTAAPGSDLSGKKLSVKVTLPSGYVFDAAKVTVYDTYTEGYLTEFDYSSINGSGILQPDNRSLPTIFKQCDFKIVISIHPSSGGGGGSTGQIMNAWVQAGVNSSATMTFNDGTGRVISAGQSTNVYSGQSVTCAATVNTDHTFEFFATNMKNLVDGGAQWTVKFTIPAPYPSDIHDGTASFGIKPYAMFRIAFNKQGGDGGHDYTDVSSWHLVGEGHATEDLTSIVPPTRTGYNFLGYYSDTNGQGTKYFNADGSPAGPKWTAALGDKTLYANWEDAKVTLTVQNDGNGSAVIKSSNSTSGSYVINTGVVLKATPNNGYTFNKWTVTSGTSTLNNANSTEPTITIKDNTTVKASFNIITYTVSYNKNGGSGTDIANQTKNHGTTLKLSDGNGWSKTGTETGYKVTFNANGGTGNPQAQTATNNLTYKIDGWATSTTGNSTYALGGNYTSNASIELFAHYALDKRSYGSITLQDPGARDGYVFGGWALPDGTIVGTSGSYTPTANVTLTAVWTVLSFKITYDGNGGATTRSSQIADYGAVITDLPTAERIGYNFIGWYTQRTGGTKVTSITVPAHDVVYYAHWEGKQYHITFNKNGGTGGTDSTDVAYESPMPSITLPTRNKHEFDGYYYRRTKYYNADGSSARNWDRPYDATLIARWKLTGIVYAQLGDRFMIGKDTEGGVKPSEQLKDNEYALLVGEEGKWNTIIADDNLGWDNQLIISENYQKAVEWLVSDVFGDYS